MTKITSIRTVFSGRITEIEEHDIDFGDHQATFELIKFKNIVTGVSALPIDKDGKIILIKHFQLGLATEGWSLPTGGLPLREAPEERMQIELQEEIGYKAEKLTLMCRVHSLPGYIGSEPVYLYLAEELEPSNLTGDEDFTIEVARFSLKEVLAMIVSGEIKDGRTMLAVLYYQQFFSR